ncbi:hypothetical protein WN51_01492 [Melipona quadrifasciata]|uniref:Uncharacterized protein n=1 Tax=Melipona quadrifasciata TaxID=166423 RepID=A0A0M8ZYU3_9HYME|nr:hypothetical protein WN51_01492 [Melipona quadrifasciata]
MTQCDFQLRDLIRRANSVRSTFPSVRMEKSYAKKASVDVHILRRIVDRETKVAKMERHVVEWWVSNKVKSKKAENFGNFLHLKIVISETDDLCISCSVNLKSNKKKEKIANKMNNSVMILLTNVEMLGKSTWLIHRRGELKLQCGGTKLQTVVDSRDLRMKGGVWCFYLFPALQKPNCSTPPFSTIFDNNSYIPDNDGRLTWDCTLSPLKMPRLVENETFCFAAQRLLSALWIMISRDSAWSFAGHSAF